MRLALLALLPFLLAAEKPWPQKGDKIYIPIPLSVIRTGQALIFSAIPYDRLTCENTAFCWYNIPPCATLKVISMRKGGQLLLVEDLWSQRIFFEGKWRSAITPTKYDCKTAAEVGGLSATFTHRYTIEIH